MNSEHNLNGTNQRAAPANAPTPAGSTRQQA
jgi:hypothetical protein